MKKENEETLPRNRTKRLPQSAIGNAIPCGFQDSRRHLTSDYPASEATYTHRPSTIARAADSRMVHFDHVIRFSGDPGQKFIWPMQYHGSGDCCGGSGLLYSQQRPCRDFARMGPLLRVSRFAQHLTHGFGRMSQKQRCFKELIGEYQMPLMTVVLTICVVGILLWLINRFIPMQGQSKES